jgi:hypothetical protein
MRSLAPLLATLLLLAACDDKAADKKADKKADKQAAKQPDDKQPDDKQVDAKQPEPPKPADTAVLTLGAAKLMPKDQPNEAFELLADGTLKMAGAPETLKISTDGKISKADGTAVAQVNADGSLSFDGKPSGVVLNDTGLVLTSPDGKTATVRFNDDGSITIEPPPAEDLEMVAEGCTGPMAKTCGVMMTMLVLRAEGPDEAKTAVEVGPDPAVAEPKKP